MHIKNIIYFLQLHDCNSFWRGWPGRHNCFLLFYCTDIEPYNYSLFADWFGLNYIYYKSVCHVSSLNDLFSDLKKKSLSWEEIQKHTPNYWDKLTTSCTKHDVTFIFMFKLLIFNYL